MLEKYLKLLGVQASSSIEEIKKAYRKKAKSLHPDLNKDPNAHQQFLTLKTAYEYVLRYKRGPLPKKVVPPTRTASPRAPRPSASRQAKTPPPDPYQKSWEIFTHFIFFHFCIFIALMPLWGYLVWEVPGLMIGTFSALITAPLIINGLKNVRTPNYPAFFGLILSVFKSKKKAAVLIALFNGIIFFTICSKTLIPLPTLILVYFLSILLPFLIVKIIQEKDWFITSSVSPGVVSLIFLLNYIFSSQPYEEKYAYQNYTETQPRSTIIYLENDAYKNYMGIRFFLDFDAISQANTITYVFEKGLFGLRVMKEYKLSVEYPYSS